MKTKTQNSQKLQKSPLYSRVETKKPYRNVTNLQYNNKARPHVSGYFLIRNFFFPDTKISASTRYVITAYSYRIRPSTRIRIHSGFTED